MAAPITSSAFPPSTQLIDLPNVKSELLFTIKECSSRGLLNSVKWAAELSCALSVTEPSSLPKEEDFQDFLQEFDKYTLAKAYFDLKEYDRAAHVVKQCKSAKAYFLHMYARYMSGEKKRYDEMPDPLGPMEYSDIKTESLKTLRMELSQLHQHHKLDGYSAYLYGAVLKKLGLFKEAREVLIEAVNKTPLHWGGWLELSSLITDINMISSVSFPNHWIKEFFLAHIYLELQMHEEALLKYDFLKEAGFHKSTYIMAQIAMATHNMRDADIAVDLFAELQEVDPYRLEHMDIYSNLLYVKEMKPELGYLAHKCCEIDKYRVETCCVIGNFYSLRSQHEKAALYFQRSLKLNPHYLAAWTLMGHEYMEMKNTSAAIQAYRQAIEVNRRDYRAWYGLGQTYEILKMPFYCLYYYKQAQKLRPNDSRMLVALGESLEKLERIQAAKKCYWRAYSVGDVEGQALIKLAKLHENLKEEEQAATFYAKFVEQSEVMGTVETEERCHAYYFLADYYMKQGSYEEASSYAHKCCAYNETKENGKAILRQIANLRVTSEVSKPDDSPSEHCMKVSNENTPMRTGISPMDLTFTP
ncbi:cell division cycle protein 23 homolog [Saccoglossus kowalevskii]|uniref:Cell division cycle protein 23 homolog n=1 Tax=Saccoglossus kowalevskii TaxID=10224 RepID=A0ABM0LV20_SACKO|nr:PREDICTED: cell division cycle protein 23 homolog [Saccoglossus kowalevskii]